MTHASKLKIFLDKTKGTRLGPSLNGPHLNPESAPINYKQKKIPDRQALNTNIPLPKHKRNNYETKVKKIKSSSNNAGYSI